MATTNAANAVNTQTIYQQNPYLTMSQTSMANDFFGSQAFGTTPIFAQAQVGTVTPSINKLGEGSGSLASIILQNYYASKNGISGSAIQNNQAANFMRTPTVQDYYTATQIANVFANNTPLINPNTNFFEKDMFAQQLIKPYSNGRVSYSA